MKTSIRATSISLATIAKHASARGLKVVKYEQLMRVWFVQDVNLPSPDLNTSITETSTSLAIIAKHVSADGLKVVKIEIFRYILHDPKKTRRELKRMWNKRTQISGRVRSKYERGQNKLKKTLNQKRYNDIKNNIIHKIYVLTVRVYEILYFEVKTYLAVTLKQIFWSGRREGD